MRLLKYTLLALTLLSSSILCAQERTVKKISKDYNNLEYIKTSEILLEVAENGYESKNLLQKLGNSFYFNNKMEGAAKWYGKLMALEEDIDPEYYFRYAQALKFIENYQEADKWMQKFNETNPSDSRAKAFVSKDNYLSLIEASSTKDISIKNLNINSPLSDFGTTQYKDQIIIASTRGGGKLYKWNEQPFLDLYSAQKQDDGSYVNVLPFSDIVNTEYHESTASFSPDEETMYFTRNNFYQKKLGTDDKNTNRLQMFRARAQDNNNWDDVQPIHFNSDDYSVAHPVVNASGTKVYFASDMPGTVGQSDLYVASINEDGSLGDPTNLGKAINTEGKESFPFINAKGDFYFSSNGFPGLGGLDVYVIRDFENTMTNSMSQNFIVENVGKPINSAQDDFGYYENLDTKEGFFTSNRDGGKGDDDIYSFTIPECAQVVEGTVKDIETMELLSQAIVTLFDGEGTQLQQITVGDDAAYKFEGLACEKTFLVRGEKETYASTEKRFTTPNKKQKTEIELLLKKDKVKLEPCADLAKILDISIIYFDFDRFNIRSDAEVELQKVLAVLNQYPTMTIAIRSHTDCRGTVAYNEKLSNDRAKSTRQYFIDKGIAVNRLTAIGYGESRLINDCGCEPSNNSNCSETEHQLNRRSEFIITSLNGEKCLEN